MVRLLRKARDEPRPAPAVSAQISGDVAGQVVVGHHNVQVNAAAGARVEVLAPAELPVPDARPLPLSGLAGRDFPGLIGRDAELRTVLAGVRDGGPVEVSGP